MAETKDPVAEKSTFLCMYMSNHPDTLVAYVKHFGKVKEKVSSAKMTAIDTNGMNLSYRVSDSKVEKDVRVVFDPPLAGYDEVKPRLLGMTADAQESLGMTKAPQITSFELPRGVWKTGVAISCLVYVMLSPYYSGTQWSLGKYLYFGIGKTTLNIISAAAALVHLLEAVYVARLCSKHRTGPVVQLQYFLSTFVFGFTVLVPFRKRIQKARIDSIMKGN
ncbi:hypothetical protein SCHPADRAFT_833802 [Schizopora paradoxa]|uniref:DUF2470 domain-containing protein n=1 Tax=Schizopora paradoxa TaxID=27342 RepID=A0A0H2RJI0_9AGAM|nr:hypothetical protein SCHPADRAFT_833802 [Schizopora paradoxa]